MSNGDKASLSIYTIATIISTTVIILCLLYNYARRKISPIIYIVTFIAWSMSFGMTSLLPLDYTGKYFEQLKIVWQVIYWTSFSFSWIIIPMIQEYHDNGGFTRCRRFLLALRFNIIFFGAFALILCIFAVWIMIKDDVGFKELKGLAICAANTFGLLLLVLLLGYGLVEIPRSLWFTSNRVIKLKYVYYRLSHLHSNCIIQQDKLQQVYEYVQRLNTQVPVNSEYRQYVDQIVSKCPDPKVYEFARVMVSRPVEIVKTLEKLKNVPINLLELKDYEEINFLVSRQLRKLAIQQADWNDLTTLGVYLEKLLVYENNSYAIGDIDKIQKTKNKRYSSIQENESIDMNEVNSSKWNYIKFHLYVHGLPKFQKVLAVLAALMSLLILWCEVTIISPVELSPIAIAVKSSSGSLFLTQLTTLIPVVYILLCTFYTLFIVRVFSIYSMHNNGRTDGVSLLHNAVFTLRLLPPIASNYFQLLSKDDAAFHAVIGNMESIPFLGRSFTEIIPFVILIVAVGTCFNLFRTVLKWLEVPNFEYSEHFEDDNIEDGKQILRSEKRLNAMTKKQNNISYIDQSLL